MMELSEAQKADFLTKRLSSKVWRLNNLYWIKDAQGEKVKFCLNWAQRDLFNSLHYFNVVLKARQLGMTTLIMLYFLDDCLFNKNISAGVIAHTRDDAEDLFKNKIKFAYDSLDDWVKECAPATQDSSRRLEFANGSSITVGTSLRSGTFQRLLVSEYGKIAARYPEKAKEIKTGALNTVHLGQQIFVESTAEGKQGEFYDLCERAKKLQHSGVELTRLDPKLHFYSWFQNPEYSLSEKEIGLVSIDGPMNDYFTELKKQGIDLMPGQKAWYVKKSQQQGEDIKREFPSTPEESFEQSMEGAYFTRQMELVRKARNIRPVNWEPSKPVHTFWDIADNSDYMAVWFFQHVGSEYRFIRYLQASGEDYGWFKNQMNSFGYVYGTHYWPHDGGNKTQTPQGLMSKKQIANTFGIAPITIVKRTSDKMASIQKARTIIPRCQFCEINASEGIQLLDSYRKEWNDKLSMWKETPRHDEASHCADAFMTFTDGYQERAQEFIDYSSRQQMAEDYDPFSV